MFQAHAKKSGLPRIRLHDLRHSYARLALVAGTDARVVSDRIGHSSTAFTQDTYQHVQPKLQEASAEALAALILGEGFASG
jgi:integrase